MKIFILANSANPDETPHFVWVFTVLVLVNGYQVYKGLTTSLLSHTSNTQCLLSNILITKRGIVEIIALYREYGRCSLTSGND